ncbi:HTH-type transcriptional regulator AdhR [Pelotomaculum schinkii]|uniref:HTH-type transcriptional regulator AdhR n=1 Tax=Pelotomaculum schinkii TaxID=78350 RepID=A0A4Y7RBA4_9FIRM|nr:MerR family transcriptional regulator [Pelotomaculum schinkii]TEB06096.1 HTH-type transcriptional regulator AdhR [Pelotomaculum schinkii]
MYYSIGEVANKMGIAASTLRYYDREGLFPDVGRSSGGIRVFTDTEIETLKIIECLKTTGMQIKDVKQFLDWCKEGDTTLQQRRDMFYERKAAAEKQLAEIERALIMIKFKCWYYDTALEAGTETVPKNMPIEKMPDEVKEYKCTLSDINY